MPGDEREREVGIQQKREERGIFGDSPNPEARFIRDHEELDRYVEAARTFKLSIVLTSGSFDLIHIGHARYLEEAKKCGDILIVGVDSDEKVRRRKGPSRPVVSESERVDMLAHLRSVDIITLKEPDEPKWDMIKRIRPDTLIVTRETYDDETLKELGEYCGRVMCLEPQATTSTSAKIRLLQVGWSKQIEEPVMEELREYEREERAVDEALIRSIGGKLVGQHVKRP